MKKLFVASLVLIAFISFAFQKKGSKISTDTPSVSKAKMVSDSADLDEQMKKLEAEMKAKELDMKPFEEEMKKLEKEMKLVEEKMNKANDLGEAEMAKLEKQMEELGDKMSKVGDEMGLVGDAMGQVGDKMSEIGDKMHEMNDKVFTWFFNELKKDGLLNEGKCRIVFDEDMLLVNDKKLSTAEIQKYKKGIESRLGKPMKSDFTFFFKGTLKNLTAEKYDFDGNMNVNY